MGFLTAGGAAGGGGLPPGGKAGVALKVCRYGPGAGAIAGGGVLKNGGACKPPPSCIGCGICKGDGAWTIGRCAGTRTGVGAGVGPSATGSGKKGWLVTVGLRRGARFLGSAVSNFGTAVGARERL